MNRSLINGVVLARDVAVDGKKYNFVWIGIIVNIFPLPFYLYFVSLFNLDIGSNKCRFSILF